MHVDPAGGVVVMTRFECPTIRRLLSVVLLHWRVKRDVHRKARGLVAVRMIVVPSERMVTSISIWRDLDSVYSMGDVRRHVTAARLAGSWNVRTANGVFCYVGDWRRVMFGGAGGAGSPLQPVSAMRGPIDTSDDDKKG